jgi:hypothetical protein
MLHSKMHMHIYYYKKKNKKNAYLLMKSCWNVLGICQDQKINATLRRDSTIFKVIIAPTLKDFCFWVKGNSPPEYNKVINYRKKINFGNSLKEYSYKIVYLTMN